MYKPMNSLQDILQSTSPTIPVGLETGVQQRIAHESLVLLRQRLILAKVGILSSLIFFFFSLWWIGGSIRESEFWSISFLFFSDGKTLLTLSGQYILSLLETLPAFSFSLLLTPIFSLCLFSALWKGFRRKEIGLPESQQYSSSL